MGSGALRGAPQPAPQVQPSPSPRSQSTNAPPKRSEMVYEVTDPGRILSIAVFGLNGTGRDRLSRSWTRFYTLEGADSRIVYHRHADGLAVDVETCGSHVEEVIRRRLGDWIFSQDCYMLCFDLTNESTFNWVPADVLATNPIQFQPPHVIERVRSAKKYEDEEEIPMILVGLKADLKEQRQVSRETAEAFAHRYRIPYIEVDTSKQEEVDAAFLSLIAEARKKGVKRPRVVEPPRVPQDPIV